MKVELVDKPCVISVTHTKYHDNLKLFELDYNKLYYEWYKDAMQIPPTNGTKLIPHRITIKNPISGYECTFDLHYYQGDTNVDHNDVQPNQVAKYDAWFGDPDETYYELAVTVPVEKAEDEWVDISEYFHDTWKPYIAGIDPHNDLDDIGIVYNGNATLDADTMMKIAEWFSRVK